MCCMVDGSHLRLGRQILRQALNDDLRRHLVVAKLERAKVAGMKIRDRSWGIP